MSSTMYTAIHSHLGFTWRKRHALVSGLAAQQNRETLIWLSSVKQTDRSRLDVMSLRLSRSC